MGIAVADLRFDSTVPVELQLTDYSCSVGATFWCLRSLGVSLAQQDLQAIMVPALVSPDLGLLDGSGATIARLLQRQFGLTASNTSPTSFDDVAARAGTQPIAIGGSRWFVSADGTATGHWVAVRGFDGMRLLLANPGGTGPAFGQQVLTPDDFARRAPFAAVWMDAAGPATLAGPRFQIANTDGLGAHVREQPSTDASIVASLREGAQLSGGEHAWRAVSDAGGTQGWVADEYLHGGNGTFQVANTGGFGANLRSDASTTAAVITLLAEGTELTAADHAWRQVTAANGVSGWVANEFLQPVSA